MPDVAIDALAVTTERFGNIGFGQIYSFTVKERLREQTFVFILVSAIKIDESQT